MTTYRVMGGRRRAVLAVLAAMASLLIAGPASAQQGGERPNVVVFLTDDQDARSLRFMPEVERHLVRRGTRFATNFATTPVCCPSRATFLTGQYSHNHGVRGKPPPFQSAGFREFRDDGVLPISLRNAGYRTAYVGKYLNGYGEGGSDPRFIPQGWDRWYAPVRGTATHKFDYTLNENGRLNRYGERRSDYQTDVFARHAKRFIQRSAGPGSPFFLTVSPSAPHGDKGVQGADRNPRPAPRHDRAFLREPLPKPSSFNEGDVRDKPSFIRDERRLGREAVRKLTDRYRARLASLLAIDDAVGGVVRRLRRSDELDNTIIIYTSDNGYLHGEHRVEGKVALYEESAQVPLVVRGPSFPAGVTRQQVTGNIDLAPTIIEEPGAVALRVMDGIPLGPLATDPGQAQGRDILLENALSNGVRDARYVYYEHPGGERELYDLRRDPFQLTSRHSEAAYSDVRNRLAARLRALENCSGASCR